MWHYFAATVLEFELSGRRCTVDLRLPLNASKRGELAMLGLERPFCVITTCDPLGRMADDASNVSRSRVLEVELRAMQAMLASATGRSPDGAHAEPGFACAVTRAQGVRLACRFEQLALFWFDGHRFWLVGGVIRSDDVALPRNADDVVTPPSAPFQVR